MELQERLAELRRERGLSQKELARELGVTRQAVSKWERGVIAPATINLIALGRVYGIPLDELVNEEPPIKEPAVAVAERPEDESPPKKAGTLKIVGAAVAAVFVLLVAVASAITIVSAVTKEPDPPKSGIPITDQNDLRIEDIDLSEIIDSSGDTINIEP